MLPGLNPEGKNTLIFIEENGRKIEFPNMAKVPENRRYVSLLKMVCWHNPPRKKGKKWQNAAFAAESAIISPSIPEFKSLNTDHADSTKELVIWAEQDIYMQEKQKKA